MSSFQLDLLLSPLPGIFYPLPLAKNLLASSYFNQQVSFVKILLEKQRREEKMPALMEVDMFYQTGEEHSREGKLNPTCLTKETTLLLTVCHVLHLWIIIAGTQLIKISTRKLAPAFN